MNFGKFVLLYLNEQNMNTVSKIIGFGLLAITFASCNTQKEVVNEVVIQDTPPPPPVVQTPAAPVEQQATQKSAPASTEQAPVFKTQEMQMNRKPSQEVINTKKGK